MKGQPKNITNHYLIISMKLKSLKKRIQALGRLAVAGLLCGLAVVSCKDDDNGTVASPFDPAQPIVITSFTPESGGSQDQIIIKGKNFGNDKSRLSLSIGGKEAVVINVMSDKLYAIVPQRAFSGEIAITVIDDSDKAHTAVADKRFNYEAQPVVGTLCGYRNDNDNQGEMWGSFDVCTGFNSEGTLAIDPLYPNRVYICYDAAMKIAQLDLEKRECTLLMSANKFQQNRLRNIDFSLDGQYMLVSTDRADQDTKSTSVWIVTRNSDGTFNDRSSCQPLVAYKQCNGVAVHPVNGEVYFNSYSNGELFRMSLDDYFASFVADPETGEKGEWTGYREDGAFTELFKIQDPSYEFQMTIHPSGDYAYITVINRNYILRTDYNWSKKEFMTPYVVSGMNSGDEGRGWVDAVGTNARFARPYQGVFVKNPQYEAEGRPDVYDFYVADCLNFCIRSITPEGIVRTYAGHTPSTDGNIWGTEDGALRTAARFRDVTGLAYDYQREQFYVLDHNNRRIRTIGKESEDTQIETPAGPTEGDGENATEE